MIEIRDSNLVSGLFLEDNIPNNKYYLKKYFKSNLQNKFLCYYLAFGSYYYFSRHSGVKCSLRYLKIMKKKLVFLENLRDKAKKDFDLDLLQNIENGNYKYERSS